MEVNQQKGDGEAAARGENPSRTCKLPAGRVVLLVLVGLLAAALIVVFRLSFDKIQMNQTIKTLEEENEALRRNQSDKMCLKWAKDWDQYEEKCYYFNFIKSSWNDSRRSCADLGSDLVKIDSREEQMFLNKRLRDLMVDDEDKFWIGLTDSGEEGRWFWVDGSPLDERFH
ncbi:CD209 antigen-like protein E [Xiphophorus couchianus]|uniref:CD209 antigen-like protein E n=1 Tax=Xiphophorus couchianus TaxID=32473 RepID=UPI001015F5C1|nr:CD209 antigen-like protein E [Xiphophorus couchianus]